MCVYYSHYVFIVVRENGKISEKLKFYLFYI